MKQRGTADQFKGPARRPFKEKHGAVTSGMNKPDHDKEMHNFKIPKTRVEYLVKKFGYQCFLVPKYHCQLNEFGVTARSSQVTTVISQDWKEHFSCIVFCGIQLHFKKCHRAYEEDGVEL